MNESSLEYWKRQCALAEKQVKGLSEAMEDLKHNHAREISDKSAQIQFWKDKAEKAEKELKDSNFH